MDQIIIENLEIFGHHGVFEEESFLGQKFVVTAKLNMDVRKAGRTDDLQCSVDYGQICQVIVKFVENERFSLIETVAEQLAEKLLLTFEGIYSVELTVKKPWAPLKEMPESVAVRVVRGWHTVYLSIGSNMGDREGYLDFAIDQLNALPDTKVSDVSDYLETEPYGGVEQDDFLNGALCLQTLKTPEELLETTMGIEKAAHRERLVHWGPRTLDIDILFYDDKMLHTQSLTIPHPEIPKRAFVLEPLAAIAPYYVHPALQKTVTELWEDCKTKDMQTQGEQK